MNQQKPKNIEYENFKLSIIIPVYNERETIHEIIDAVEATPFRKEIIAVDDCSNDGTRDVLNEIHNANLKIFQHHKNQGKGAALRSGFAAAAFAFRRRGG